MKAKWLQNDIVHGEDVSADAITNCMSTRQNTLSVWQAGGVNELDEAVLAMIASHDHLDTIDVVALQVSALDEQGIEHVACAGDTPIKDLVDTHEDLVSLSYPTLGLLAGQIAAGFRNNSVQRYTFGRQKELLRSAIEKGRLSISELKPCVRDKLEH